VFPLSPYRLGFPDGIVSSTVEAEYGLHGGEMETSIIMALAPELVRNEHLVPGSTWVQDTYSRLNYLSLESALPTAWLLSDISANGVIGDPSLATPEKGEKVLRHVTEKLAGVYAEISAFEFMDGGL
jgi:creatinine amidohydrolase